MKLGKSQREKEPTKVASVAAYSPEGLLLFGLRQDSEKWTLPGGHLEPGEAPLEGAKRELLEEAGLEGKNFQYLGSGLNEKGNVLIYSYRCTAEGDPDGSKDPDEECQEWRWVEPSDIPSEISENLHDPNNITLRLSGLQDGEVEEPMAKKADPHFVEKNPYRGDPIKIPKSGTKSRKEYEKAHQAAIAQTFAGGDIKRLKPIRLPITDNMGGINIVRNMSRYKLYQRMIRAGDKLPPVAAKRMGSGWHLLDGEHRKEAAKAAGLPYIEAYEILDPLQRSETTLEKVSKLGGALLATSLMAGSMAQAPEHKEIRQPQTSIAAPTPAHEIAQSMGFPKWTPDGLSAELHPIAHLESSFGLNMEHAPHSKGEYHTAYGAVGFKPITAHEEWKKSKLLQSKYPGLTDPSEFTKHFKQDPKFYNLLASAWFHRLLHRHKTPEAAAYAWRWGSGATETAAPEDIENDSYVQKYKHMLLHQQQHSSLQATHQQAPAHHDVHGRRPMHKSDVHDPIDPMLDHDDPKERILALKHARVTPYHIRRAMYDEDPDVRAFAVKHRKMTSALIEEALKHPEQDTREAVLERPDLQEHHLESVLFDPDLQVQVARHPALTEDQRKRLTEHQATPKGLVQELVHKTEEDLIREWALAKIEDHDDVSYNAYEDMLGIAPRCEAYLMAVKFLARQEPDAELFRHRLVEDADMEEAALNSVGLDADESNRKALRAVLELQDHPLGKALGETTHEVQAMMPDGAEVAEGVRRGFGADTEKPLQLGGRHSAGAMAVRDPDTQQMYLVKPGSGKQSPAMGAREEKANQSRREAAFWHVAQYWGLEQRFPRADLILLDGKEVAILHMLPFDWKNLEKLKLKDAGLPAKALEKYRQTGELHKWAVLDYILGNPDRHGQNLMVGPAKEQYPVALIDHGSAFAGKDFDPANDKNSFIPYYLRAWHAESWPNLDTEARLRSMPTLNRPIDQEFREWVQRLHADDLSQLLTRYGIDPQPSLDRLAKVRTLLAADNLSQAINRLWITT